MATRIDDRKLVAQAQAGEVEAFVALVDRYRDAVIGVAYHYLGSFEDAQDAAQGAFVRAYLHLKQLRDPARFGPWLRRIAVRYCADLLRQRKQSMLSLEAVPEAASSSQADDERIAARLVVREALIRLPERARLTATLFYIDGYSHQEIADFLEVSPAAVRSNLSRARKKLREEMITMVGDVFNEGKPGPQFTRQAVEEAMRRAREAWKPLDWADGLHQLEEALSALDRMERSPENLRLRMEVLQLKGSKEQLLHGAEESIRDREQAFAIASELGDVGEQARCLERLGMTYQALGQAEKGEQYLLQALEAYRASGDVRLQASCLSSLSHMRLQARDFVAARRYLEDALPVCEQARDLELTLIFRAGLRVLEDVGEERYPLLLHLGHGCNVLESKQGAVTQLKISGGWAQYGVLPPALVAISTGVVLHGPGKNKLLDSSVPAGEGWTGEDFWLSLLSPLQMRWTVRSTSERIVTPAGAFENCLLMELTTPEIDLPDRIPVFFKEFWPGWFHPRRRFWYSPGVGIVQVHAERGDGAEAVIQLREFSIVAPSSDYLPLAIGNSWSYQWADAPPEYLAKYSYRVAGHEGDKWYLEHYYYAYKASEGENS